ncbi:MAG TPA: aspartate kinase [Flavobacteriales bacterium]|nr:aspartate kinase [Flavobacteriales bacterium]
MRIFKFGGASVKDPNAVRNVKRVLDLFPEEELVVVISAMGKTTNALESLIAAHIEQTGQKQAILNDIRSFHHEILSDLFSSSDHAIHSETENCLNEIEKILNEEPMDHYDFIYDQVVSFGEILSTKIVSAFLQDQGVDNVWLDARKLVCTDNTYREAKVNWNVTQERINSAISQSEGNKKIHLTQGFIGHTSEGLTTTLGREGSDFTAGIFAYCLDAEDVTIWKDVPGMLNADPKWFEETEKLDEISYREAIELAYYGASVIHPKTIKPLQNKQIPLLVKSFLDPESEGTIIQASNRSDGLITSYIFKRDQILISISPKDFSFIVEHNLRDIFNAFHEHRVKINLMQNSAISFSACAGGDQVRIDALINDLSADFAVKYNSGVELLTIRHYDQETIDRLTGGKEILVIQRSRQTARVVMK